WLTVHVVTRRTRDESLGRERQHVGNWLLSPYSGVMGRAYVMTEDASLLEIGGEQRPRRDPVALERGLVGGVTAGADGVRTMHVLAGRGLGHRRAEEHPDEEGHEDHPPPPR